MKKNRQTLLLVSLIVVVVMCIVTPVSVALMGNGPGIAFSMMIYWFGLCLPAALYFQGRSGLRRALALVTNGHAWAIPLTVAIPIVLLGYVWFDMGILPSLGLFLICLPAALINGTLEEAFWRGSYLKIGGKDLSFQLLGVGLFTLWHVALILPSSVTHYGGPHILLLGAFALGLIWMWMAQKTEHIGWSAVSHIAVNATMFPVALMVFQAA